ncbi:MAG: hypothetical protein ACJ8HI_13850 [Massilia sp.]
MSTCHRFTRVLPFALLALLSTTATAEDKQTAAKLAAPASWPAPAGAERLAGQRGGADTINTQAAQSTLTATVADNSARNVVTGNNTIDNGAFANLSGLPMVIQNTGANVLIQNSTVINLQMR